MVKLTVYQWLTPLLGRDQEFLVQNQLQQIVCEPYLENTQHKTVLVEWFKW
jgi:hypothetical protein